MSLVNNHANDEISATKNGIEKIKIDANGNELSSSQSEEDTLSTTSDSVDDDEKDKIEGLTRYNNLSSNKH